jgi:hypothetical protein
MILRYRSDGPPPACHFISDTMQIVKIPSAVFLGLLLPSFPGSGTFNQTGYLNGMTGEYEEPGTNFY